MKSRILSGTVLDENSDLSLAELCNISDSGTDWIAELVDEGIIEPSAGGERGMWRFSAICVNRVESARRLQRDLEINLAGVAMTLELLDEISRLRTRLKRFEQNG